MTIQDDPVAPYRVAQWATGNIGTHALRSVIEHPQMELVGLWVHSEAKVGRDAGELCGLGREVGVKATNRLEDILAAKPDCVLYMPQYTRIDEVCAILASGANISTTVVEFHHPASLDPEVREQVEAACRQGGTTIYSTGSSPGFISEAMPIVLASIQRRFDSFTIHEFADMTSRDSPGLLFDVLGLGKPPAGVDDRQLGHIRMSYGESFRQTAEALGLPLDDVQAVGELGTARRRTEIAAGVIEAGTTAAIRIAVDGLRDGKPVMRFRANWYVTTDLEQDWELRPTGWRLELQGDCPLDIGIRFPVSDEDYPKVSPGLTANPAVNAVPAVCAAEPGIRTTVDLPKIIARFG